MCCQSLSSCSATVKQVITRVKSPPSHLWLTAQLLSFKGLRTESGMAVRAVVDFGATCLGGLVQDGSSHSYKFGVFEFDPISAELRKQGIRIKLQDQPAQILAVLLEHPGEIVTREDLRTRVWPSDTFVDFDHGLYSAVKRLRDALGDAADIPRYIETVSKRGYRFIGAVQVTAIQRSHTSDPATRVADFQFPKKALRTRSLIAVFVVCGTLAGVLVASSLWYRPKFTIAVLPFSYPQKDLFLETAADTLTNSLIVDLTKLSRSGIRTKSRAAVQPFRGGSTEPLLSGKQLQADFVVYGKVNRAEGQLSVDAELISINDGSSEWAGRDLRWETFQLAVMKRDLLKEVVDHLPIRLTSSELTQILDAKPAKERNPRAEEIDKQAQSLFWTGTPEGFRKSIELRHREVGLDASAIPLGGIAAAYAAMADLEIIPPGDGRAKALEWANRALQLDETDFGALITLDRVERNLAWESQAFKENEFVRGNMEEVLNSRKRFVSENPGLPAAYDLLAGVLIFMRRYSDAAEQEKISLDLEPERAWSNFNLGNALLYQRHFAEAINRFNQSRGALPVHSLAGIARALALSGKKQQATRKLEELTALSHKDYVSPVMFARVHAALGDKTATFQYLLTACHERVPAFLSLKFDPAWDALRHEGRFTKLLRCAGIEP